MSRFIKRSLFALVFVGVVALAPAGTANAQSSSVQDMLDTIQSLLVQIENLQKQLADLRGEVRNAIADGLEEGMTHEDIREIQKILATDPDIYPRGIVSGYFGPLTRDALMRFQAKHDLSTTGRLDSETRELLEEYLDERFNGNIPPGLLRAPGIQKKVHDRVCSENHFMRSFGLFCRDFDNDRDDNRDDKDELEVEVEEHNGRTHVHVEYRNGREESFYISADIDDEDEVIEDIADKTGLDEDDIEDVIEFKDRDDEDDEDDDHEHEGFEDVSVEVDSGDTTVSFTYNGDDYVVEVNSTDDDEILEEIADELDMDVDDLDDDFVDDVLDELEDELEDEDNGIEVRIEYDGDDVTVEFTFEGDDYEVEVNSTDRDDIFDEIADELDVDVENLDDDLIDLIDEALDDAGL